MSQVSTMPGRVTNRLSEHLGRQRMSVSELARKAELSYPTVLDIYHDRAKTLRFDTIERLCDALGIPLSELFEYIPQENGD